MEVLQRDTENENKEPKEIENETSPVEDTTQPTTSSNEENTVAEVIQNEVCHYITFELL